MKPAANSLPDLAYVRELGQIFQNHGLDEIEIETGELRILLRRGDMPAQALDGAFGSPEVPLKTASAAKPTAKTKK